MENVQRQLLVINLTEFAVTLLSDVCFTVTSSASLVECLRDLIKTSETGRLFDGLRNQYLQALPYLSDYVHMVYKPSSTLEHEVFKCHFSY